MLRGNAVITTASSRTIELAPVGKASIGNLTGWKDSHFLDFGIEITIRRLNMNTETDEQRIEMSAIAYTGGYNEKTHGSYVSYVAGAKYERERVSQEVAELRKENEALRKRIDEDWYVVSLNQDIKRLTEALSNILKVCKSPTLTTHGLNHIEAAEQLLAKSALSGTKETE